MANFDQNFNFQWPQAPDDPTRAGPAAIDWAAHRLAMPIAWAKRCLALACNGPAELTVRVVDEAEGRALNRQFRGMAQDHATNVLTFGYATRPVIHADLVLCAPVVAKEAAEQGKPLRAHYTHLLVHGALHAQGYDHETSAQAAHEMEALEVLLLGALGLANPYQD